MLNFGDQDWQQAKQFFQKMSLDLSRQAEVITGPLQMGIDVTNRCVMRCLHCFNRSETVRRDEMSSDRLRHAFDELISIRPQQMCICGGEPLLRKKEILEASRKMVDNGIFVGMVTNGYLLTEKVAKELVAAKLGHIQVSLDGLKESHERLRGIEGGWDKAVAAIKNLKNAGAEAITSFAPLRWNVAEFPEYVDFAREIGIRDIRVQPLMPLGAALLNPEIFPTEEQYVWLSRFIKKYNLQHTPVRTSVTDINDINMFETPELGYPIIMWGDPVDHIIRFSKFITKPTYTFQILSTGRLCLSPYLPFTVGDVNKYSLKEYWKAGLNRIWEYKIVQCLAEQVRSVFDMGNIYPPTFYTQNLDFDLIENSEAQLDQMAQEIFSNVWRKAG